MELLKASGVKFVRTDLFWHRIEPTKGIYDFRGYDALFDTLQKNNIRPLFILDYMNSLYDGGLSCYTDECRSVRFRCFCN